MKNIELRKVPCGESFTVFGEEYVALDRVDGGTLAIRKEIWKKAVFDRNGKSNLTQADMRDTLAEYTELLKSRGMKDSDCLVQHIDLKATDGTRVYGYLGCTVALLTLEQYGKYKEIIPKADDWWWLATPYSTERAGYPSYVRYVYSVGTLRTYDAYHGNNGVRPALYLKSDISVSLDGNDESTIEVSEEELYKAAVQKFGERAQILVAIEEMSELTKALLKYIRHEDFNQGDYDDIVESIAEERADVSIMLNQLAVIFGKNEDAETEKLEHLADIVKDAL